MLRNKAYKFRIYPTAEQEVFFNKTIGCSRFVFNRLLNESQEKFKETGKHLSKFDCIKMLTPLKKEFGKSLMVSCLAWSSLVSLLSCQIQLKD